MTSLSHAMVTLPDGRDVRCDLVRMGPDALPALRDLQARCHGPLMHPITDEEMAGMLGEGGRVLAVVLDGRPMAFLAIQFPGRAPRNLGRLYGLPEEELKHVAHFTGVLVHPTLRGNRLHPRLIEAAARLVLPPSRRRYWFATVRPENIPSLRGMLSSGLRIVARLPLHDGHDRFLFARDTIADARPTGPAAVVCHLNDPSVQQALFARGWRATSFDPAARTLAFIPGTRIPGSHIPGGQTPGGQTPGGQTPGGPAAGAGKTGDHP